MLKLYFKTLFNNKTLLIVMLICYAVSFATVSYIYAFGKQVVYNLYADTSIYVSSNSALTFLEANALSQKIQDKGLNVYYYFDTKYGRVAYDNKIEDFKTSAFSGNNDEIVLDARFGMDKKWGDKTTIAEKEFTIVGFSRSGSFVNFNCISNDTEVFGLIMVKKSGFSKRDISKIDSAIITIDPKLTHTQPKKVNFLQEMLKQYIVVLLFGVMALCLVTTVVMNFYIVLMRKRFFSVTSSLGLSRKKSILYLLLEQLILFIPLFAIGFAIYLICYYALGNIIALLSFAEVLLLALFFFGLMSAIVTINLFGVWGKKNV